MSSRSEGTGGERRGGGCSLSLASGGKLGEVKVKSPPETIRLDGRREKGTEQGRVKTMI